MRFGLMAAAVAFACAAPASAAQIISVNVADGVPIGNGSVYASNGVTFGNGSAFVLRENGTIRVENGQFFSANYDPDWEHFTSVTLYGNAGTDLVLAYSAQTFRITLQQNGLQSVSFNSLTNYPFAPASAFRVSGDAVRVVAFAISVPEPETWALLIAGFGAIGATLRTRRLATRRWPWVAR